MESDQADILVAVSSFFEKNTIPYMITGAWSVIYYGRPRASHDIDFVVDIRQKDVSRLSRALEKKKHQYIFNKISIERAFRNKDLFQLVHKGTLLKIDCWILHEDAFDQSRFTRKQRIRAFGQRMWIASAEDTILQKIRWYKEAKIERHLIDAAFVYQIQNKKLDKHYLSHWAKELGVTSYLKKLGTIDLEAYI